ncbi:MAG: hypothetical protein ACRDZ6_11475 [Acidimicrobiales bacterium]
MAEPDLKSLLMLLERQREQVAQLFKLPDPGPPRILTEAQYEAAREIVEKRKGWTGLDRALLQAVRDGARPGDTIPPSEVWPYVRAICNIEVGVVERADEHVVAVFFDHAHFSGHRFAYLWRSPGGDTDEEWPVGLEQTWFQEELETGGLHRVMRYDAPAPDGDGVIWLRLHGDLLGVADELDTSKLFMRAIAHVEKTETGSTCGIYVPAENSPAPCRRPAVVRAAASLWDDKWTPTGPPPPTPGYVGACAEHETELHRRAEEQNGRLEPGSDRTWQDTTDLHSC